MDLADNALFQGISATSTTHLGSSLGCEGGLPFPSIDRPCPPSFRDLVLSSFRITKASHLQLLAHLLFSSEFDEDSGGRLVHRWILAECEGLTHLVHSRNYSGISFLEEVKEEVFGGEGFSWKAHRYTERHCRVAYVDWPEPILSALDELNQATPDDTWVDFVTGHRLTARERSSRNRLRQAEALELAADCEWEKQRFVLEYLNRLNPASFACFHNNLELARQTLDQIPVSDNARESQLRLLNMIAANRKPFWQPSREGRTERLFAVGGHIAGLKREVRKAASAGLWEFDLKAAQLAIVAKYWNIPEIQEFLEERGSIWESLFEWLEVDEVHRPVAKDILKEMLYSLTFGCSKTRMREEGFRELNAIHVRDPERFLQHPLIRVLWVKRQERMRSVIWAGGIRLHWGKWIPITGTTRPDKTASVRSLLARHSQAVELDLIYPIYELAAAHPKEFKVLLHQHDGVTINFHRRGELWKRRVEEAVAARASELGIATYLVAEYMDPAEFTRFHGGDVTTTSPPWPTLRHELTSSDTSDAADLQNAA